MASQAVSFVERSIVYHIPLQKVPAGHIGAWFLCGLYSFKLMHAFTAVAIYILQKSNIAEKSFFQTPSFCCTPSIHTASCMRLHSCGR